MPKVDLVLLKGVRDAAWAAYQAELNDFHKLAATEQPDLKDVFLSRKKIQAAQEAFSLAKERYERALIAFEMADTD